MSHYGLLVSFPDQSETFVLGFEAGQCWERLQAGNTKDITMHTANQEVFRRIGRNYSFDVTFEPAGEGWSVAHFSRGRPTLRAVTKSETESHSGRPRPGETSACLPADDRGTAEARSSEGGNGGQELPAVSIQSREPVDSDSVSEGAGELGAIDEAKSVDPAPSVIHHESGCDYFIWLQPQDCNCAAIRQARAEQHRYEEREEPGRCWCGDGAESAIHIDEGKDLEF